MDDPFGDSAPSAASKGEESEELSRVTHLSRSKCDSKSMRWKSWSSNGPLTPARWAEYGCETGAPLDVV